VILILSVLAQTPEQVPGLVLPDTAYEMTPVGGGDYLPVVSPDSRTMFFCSTREGGLGGEDIWVSFADSLGNWGAPENLRDLNTPLNEGPGAISTDGKALLLGYNTSPDPAVRKFFGLKEGQGGMDIFISRWKKNGWTPAENLGAVVNSPTWDAHVTMAPDGSAIYFASNREGGMGKTDIWVSKWNGQDWETPENLGPPVNTMAEEYSPFIASDGVTLYFSSNGRMGLGGQDIFVTRFTDGEWTEPKNLGEPYNTKYDDIFFSVPASGEYIYFARGDSITEAGDTVSHIYRVKLRPELAPSPVTLVKGKVYDASTGGPLRAWVTVELLETGETVQKVETDPYSGGFTLILPKRALYGVTAEAAAGDFTYSSFNYDLTDEKTYQESSLEIGLQPVKTGASFSVRNFLFDFDSDKLRPESGPELSRLASFMKEHPDIKITIEGHTDDVGEEDYNQALSERRAEAVMEGLAKMGVKKSRMNAVGHGETKPLVPNDSDENRQLNRRVEIRIE